MSRYSSIRRVAAGLAGAVALAVGGCSSGHGGAAQPPFPTDPDPCASYCLKWVPPVYRQVPKLCPESGRVVCEKVPVQKVVFEEVCRPGACTPVCVPDQCRRYGAVEVQPAHDEWVSVKCPDPCTSCCQDCYKPVHVPAKFKWCEKCETEKGFQYCSNAPTEYDVVAKTVRTCESVSRYVPGCAKVVMVSELYEPGHWVWEKRYDCCEPQRCPPAPNCAPMGQPCGDSPCAPCGTPVRGDFRRCPGE